MWGTRIGDRVEVTVGGPTRDVRIRDKVDTETYVYTEMTEVHPGSMVRACFRSASDDGGRECVEACVGEAATTARPGRHGDPAALTPVASEVSRDRRPRPLRR